MQGCFKVIELKILNHGPPFIVTLKSVFTLGCKKQKLSSHGFAIEGLHQRNTSLGLK